MSDATMTPAQARLLQDELQDLRSLSVHADHVRWITREPEGESLRTLLKGFSSEWSEWTERVALFLIGQGRPPDGRVSALTESSYRAWLPGDWLDTSKAGAWIAEEIEVLDNWTHERSDQALEAELVALFTEIERGLVNERRAVGALLDEMRPLADEPRAASGADGRVVGSDLPGGPQEAPGRAVHRAVAHRRGGPHLRGS
jgi:hypothetical protein